MFNPFENQDEQIAALNVNIHTISAAVDVPICMSIEGIKVATEEDTVLQIL